VLLKRGKNSSTSTSLTLNIGYKLVDDVEQRQSLWLTSRFDTLVVNDWIVFFFAAGAGG
jgi:hypothetical protein